MKSGIKTYSVDKFVKQFNLDTSVEGLLSSIEDDNDHIKDLLISMYSNIPISAVEEEQVLSYFINNSVFCAATVANPATSVVTELLYSRSKFQLPLDQYFSESKSGKAIHSRFFHVEENIHKLTEHYLKSGSALIGNLGGGPGRDVCNILSKYYRENADVAVVNIERDAMAITRGKRIAAAQGVLNKTEFSNTSFMRYSPEKKFDIVILVGVLCGLPPETCVAVLQNTKQMMAKGGCMMVSNVTPQMLQEDPFTYFIMEKITGWKLIFKTQESLKSIFDMAGLRWQRSFTDDYGFHLMAIGS